MKKVLPISLAVPVLALAGLGVRLWHLGSAWEGDSGMTVPWAPASVALVGLMVLAAVGLGVLARLCTVPRTGYFPNFHHNSVALLGVYILSGALVLKGGVDGIVEVFTAKAAGLGVSWLALLLAAGLIAGGVCMALAGFQGRKADPGDGAGYGPLMAPGFCGCLWLVSIYQSHTANPELFEYMFLLLGVCAAILGLYTIAGFSFEKKAKPARCVWFCAMAVILLVTDLADWRDGMTASVELGMSAFLYTQMVLLLWRGEHPPEPALPEEAETEMPPAEEPEAPAPCHSEERSDEES